MRRPVVTALTMLLTALGFVTAARPQTKPATPTARKDNGSDAMAFGLGVALGLAGDVPSADAAKNAAPASEKKPATKSKSEFAVFGGGCFWSMEAIFERIPGVKSVVSGFSGGTVVRPTYEDVCSGLTGHAEVVRIEYDPKVTTYEKLLQVFFAAHDPTTLNRQGEDVGTNYRSVIFYSNTEQMDAANKIGEELTRSGAFGSRIVTQLMPLNGFYPADKHHQDYYRKHRTSEYCRMVIAPKLMKLHLSTK
jgi:methionine-S-sulfoxide reductase